MDLKSGKPWLTLLFLTDLFFIFLLWLIAPENFGSMIVIILLFTVIILFTGYRMDRIKQREQMDRLQYFLNSPDEEREQYFLMTVDECWHPTIRIASTQMREQSRSMEIKELELQNYREFIETWTHEIRTPLSLATLVLANYKTEMSAHVYNRMEHVCHTINRDVDRILYYARLQADHVDYKFVKLNIKDCVAECLEDYLGIIEEKKIEVQFDVVPWEIISDRKVLVFMISQLLGNAFKYTATTGGMVYLKSWQDVQGDGKIHFVIRDNGKGVPSEDLPFLFDKGFTGSHPGRQNATGMGLYLVKKYAEALSIEVDIEPLSTSGEGFGIALKFPVI